MYWLGGFTYPTGFLTAVLQTAARKGNISIDTLLWDFLVSNTDEKDITQPPRDGVYIKGMFLEGAAWDHQGGCLCEPRPMELIVPMPLIQFKPVESKKKQTKGTYSCPCYLYPIRTGAVAAAHSWSRSPPLRGPATVGNHRGCNTQPLAHSPALPPPPRGSRRFASDGAGRYERAAVFYDIGRPEVGQRRSVLLDQTRHRDSTHARVLSAAELALAPGSQVPAAGAAAPDSIVVFGCHADSDGAS